MFVMSLIDMWNLIAMMSLLAARVRTSHSVKAATPRAVRVGRLRGRSSRWCSRLSPVTQASMNG